MSKNTNVDRPPRRTTPPGHPVLIYDGQCIFCTKGAKRLAGFARADALDLVDFQQPGALDRFPGLTHEHCMEQMFLITPKGKVYAGFEAAVQAAGTRPALGLPVYLYYVPGIRQICDLLYRWIAKRRYSIMGKAIARGECSEGTCAIHFRQATTKS